jgi:hypothetical protein
MIALIIIAILIEVDATGWSCVQDSISAYFFTPVRLIFVSSWIAVGFCMVVLKGSNEWEEGFLNVAGILAPVVALVPTPHTTDCTSVAPINTAPSVPDVTNNILAFLFLGTIVLILSWVALYRAAPPSGKWPFPSWPWPLNFRYILPVITLIFLAGAVTFLIWRDAFIARAHPIAASVQTGVIICVVFQNSVERGRKTNANKELSGLGRYLFLNFYSVVAWIMVVGAFLCYVVGWILLKWSGWKLTLETGEILLFAIFWLWQTRDLEKSLLPPLDRAKSPTPM